MLLRWPTWHRLTTRFALDVLGLQPERDRGGHGTNPDDFREIDVLWLRPSTSIGAIAGALADHIPAVVRYLLRGLGSDESTRDLASYLLFDATFCGRLVELGRSDVHTSRTAIERFFAKPAGGR
jgi:hypothetical protein